ncbi:hypothetical protein LCGC14_2583880, partial [marine sediment metagenome]
MADEATQTTIETETAEATEV